MNTAATRATMVLLLLAAALWASAGTARAVDVTAGTGSGLIGDVVTVPITVDDVTGEGIVAYEIQLSWTSSRASLLSAPEAGTLTAPWGVATVGTGPGQATIVAAGATPLAGSGTLINLEFELGPVAGSSTLTLSAVVFNEGSPTATLFNGSLTVSNPPAINISPDSGEIIVGWNLAFGTSGGTPPYAYSTSDPTVADFFAAGQLTGVSPGAVTVTSEDALGTRNTTTGEILVRAVSLTAGSAAGGPGDAVLIPMTISDPSGFGIVSAQFSLSFPASRLDPIGATIVGTVAETAGWGAPEVNQLEDRITVSMAGSQPLAGPGVLAYVALRIDDIAFSTSASIVPVEGLFNEAYPPLHLPGVITITVPPTITVSPDVAKITVGDELDFTVFGSVTPPVAWSVTDPVVASIDASGRLTGLSEGITEVVAVDDAGATDTSGPIQVCSLGFLGPDTWVSAAVPRATSIRLDRDPTGLGIYGYEIELTFNPSRLVATGVSVVGTLSEPWGMPVINIMPDRIIIVNAGSQELSGESPLVDVLFQALPAGIGQNQIVTVDRLLFNEGVPCAVVTNGNLIVVTETPEARSSLMRLEQNHPNPFNPMTSIRYTVGRSGHTSLRIYSASGALVRTLIEDLQEGPRRYELFWDGRAGNGEPVSSGVYYYRLSTVDGSLQRKMVLLK